MDLLEKEALESARQELDDVLKTLLPNAQPAPSLQPTVFNGPVTIHQFVQRLILKHEEEDCCLLKGERKCANRSASSSPQR